MLVTATYLAKSAKLSRAVIAGKSPHRRHDPHMLNYTSEEGHKKEDCTNETNMDLVTCRGCSESMFLLAVSYLALTVTAGHFGKDCPKQTCNNCGEPGHMAKECTEPRSNKHMTCRNCDEVGHISKECKKKRDYSRVKCQNCGESESLAFEGLITVTDTAQWAIQKPVALIQPSILKMKTMIMVACTSVTFPPVAPLQLQLPKPRTVLMNGEPLPAVLADGKHKPFGSKPTYHTYAITNFFPLSTASQMETFTTISTPKSKDQKNKKSHKITKKNTFTSSTIDKLDQTRRTVA